MQMHLKSLKNIFGFNDIYSILFFKYSVLSFLKNIQNVGATAFSKINFLTGDISIIFSIFICSNKILLVSLAGFSKLYNKLDGNTKQHVVFSLQISLTLKIKLLLISLF